MAITRSFFLAISFIFFYGCSLQQSENISRSDCKPLTKAPDDFLLCGTYQMGYVLNGSFKERSAAYPYPQSILKLTNDSDFEMNNVPSINMTDFPEWKETFSVKGKWKTVMSHDPFFDRDVYCIQLPYPPGNKTGFGVQTENCQLYTFKDAIVIWMEYGDPDSDDALIFWRRK